VRRLEWPGVSGSADTDPGRRRPSRSRTSGSLNARGSEKTFEAMAQAFPDADLFALTRDLAASFDFGGRPVNTTVLDRVPVLRRRRDLSLPLMPLAWNACVPNGRTTAS
jgi:hypothetical protein